jgi:hypothetical protein
MTYQLTDHCCRNCLGRILFDGKRYECSNCGQSSPESAGDAQDGYRYLCACGATMKSGRDARLRCVVNSKRDASFPGTIVVEQN